MENWFYLSFAAPGECLGVAIVEGHDLQQALNSARSLGIDPGGQAMGIPIPSKVLGRFAVPQRNRLIPALEAIALFKAKRIADLSEDEAKNVLGAVEMACGDCRSQK